MKNLRFVLVNFDKDRGGDVVYNRSVKKSLGEGVILASEVESGKFSVRVRPVNVKLGFQKWFMIGRVGVHRWGARRKTNLGGKKTMIISFHGLHKGSNSADAPIKYQKALAKKIRKYIKKGFEVVAGGDTNERLQVMMGVLGLKGVGSGTMQAFVTDGLKITNVEVDNFGKVHRFTNHEEVYFTVEAR